METIATLTRRVTASGRVDWIAVRPARRAPMLVLDQVMLEADGLAGDHARGAKRALTLVQGEHLPVIAAFAGRQTVLPEMLRRNIVVSGINLMALRHREVRIGGAVISVTGPCAPCSRMEETLGPGGYSAVRGHGGLTASVVEPGPIALGDSVTPLGGEIVTEGG